MKKLIALLLAVTMVAAMAAGCTPNKTTDANKDEEKVEVPASSLEILETVWASYGDDEKFFAMGGDSNNIVDNAPGAYNIEDTDGLTYQLLVPADQTDSIDGAASLVHGMMANNFTCGVFHMAEGVKAADFADAMYEAVSNNQWMCGMPETMLIAVIGGEYVLVAFGISDAMGPFETKLTAAYPKAELVYDEAITG